MPGFPRTWCLGLPFCPCYRDSPPLAQSHEVHRLAVTFSSLERSPGLLLTCCSLLEETPRSKEDKGALLGAPVYKCSAEWMMTLSEGMQEEQIWGQVQVAGSKRGVGEAAVWSIQFPVSARTSPSPSDLPPPVGQLCGMALG